MIYFLQAGECGPIKIGYAGSFRAAKGRLRSMQTGHVEMLDLLSVHPGDYDDEQALHRYFEPSHVRGEWFEPTADVLLAAESPGWALDRQFLRERLLKWGMTDSDGVITPLGLDIMISLVTERERVESLDILFPEHEDGRCGRAGCPG